MADPVNLEDRRWLHTLIAACERAAATIRGHDDPSSRHLLADIEHLRPRLEAQLHGE
jgi:hypothetical protein